MANWVQYNETMASTYAMEANICLNLNNVLVDTIGINYLYIQSGTSNFRNTRGRGYYKFSKVGTYMCSLTVGFFHITGSSYNQSTLNTDNQVCLTIYSTPAQNTNTLTSVGFYFQNLWFMIGTKITYNFTIVVTNTSLYYVYILGNNFSNAAQLVLDLYCCTFSITKVN